MFSRMRYLVLLLALSGCAGGLQAFDAPGMPAPVFTPVGAGAPVLGQPGQRRSPPVLPPSPNKRILPATREPGIWAADEPKGPIRISFDRPQIVLDIPIPYPDDAHTLDDAKPTVLCAFRINSIALKIRDPRSGVAEHLARLSPEPRGCLVARLYAYCAEMRAAPENVRRLGFTRAEDVAFRMTDKHARAFKARMCSERSDNAVVGHLVQAFKNLWSSTRVDWGQ